MSTGRETVLAITTESYTRSADFNGIRVTDLWQASQLDRPEFDAVLRSLVGDGLVDLVFEAHFPNPHIKPFRPLSPEKQVLAMEELGADTVCAYPARRHLETTVGPQESADKPYTRELALGRPQLDFEAFDMGVLEVYRNDPRYYYSIHDRGGHISVRDAYYESGAMPTGDQVVVKFGFGFSPDLRRAVVAFIRDLSGLSPEHQAIWKVRMLNGDYRMHPHHYRSCILAEFPAELSLFESVLLEMPEINKLCDLMVKPPLFRKVWEGQRPRDFGWIIRPTEREFSAFVMLLDKMLSDNINKDFFKEDLELESTAMRVDGLVEAKQKGTIALLDEWLKTFFRPKDPKPLEDAIATFREVRRLRQAPAHSVEEDAFDASIEGRQRELMIRVVEALRVVRMVLQKHPRCKKHELSDLLKLGICTY